MLHTYPRHALSNEMHSEFLNGKAVLAIYSAINVLSTEMERISQNCGHVIWVAKNFERKLAFPGTVILSS